MMMLSIDRFDGAYAICEGDNEKLYAIEKSELPMGAKPGDVLKLSSDGSLTLDEDETKRRKERIKKLQNKLFGAE